MQSLPREERLRGKDPIGRLFSEGSRGKAGTLMARALPNNLGANRVACVAGKKTGCAVERNRMRRRLRAAYRLQKHHLPSGWDIALMASRRVLEVPWQDLIRETAQAVSAATADCSGRHRLRQNR